MTRRGVFQLASIPVLAVVSLGLGALAAFVATLVDRLIANVDVSLAWAITYGLLMGVFFFVSVFTRRRSRAA